MKLQSFSTHWLFWHTQSLALRNSLVFLPMILVLPIRFSNTIHLAGEIVGFFFILLNNFENNSTNLYTLNFRSFSFYQAEDFIWKNNLYKQSAIFSLSLCHTERLLNALVHNLTTRCFHFSPKNPFFSFSCFCFLLLLLICSSSCSSFSSYSYGFPCDIILM